VQQAQTLGYAALALTDECSVAGVVRAHAAAKECKLPFIVGTELRFVEGLRCVLLATSRCGYGQLSRLITAARRAAAKGGYHLTLQDLERPLADCRLLWLPGTPGATEEPVEQARFLRERFEGRLWLAVELLGGGNDRQLVRERVAFANRHGLPSVATGDVHMHLPARRALQDTLTAIRLRVPLQAAGHALYANGERHLRTLARLEKLYPAPLLRATLEVAEQCQFSLDELRYEYPAELVPPGQSAAGWLRQLTTEGLQRRYPQGVPVKVHAQVEHELGLIAELRYEPYFLTVQDLVAFARSRGILCQGRGSAANSAVCYALGVTEVDPARLQLLVERFISRERNEPPDIDIDFEHERREEVIQYLYAKYGRDRAALAATVITYHPRSALRDVGKALGFDALQVDRLARSLRWWDGREADATQVHGENTAQVHGEHSARLRDENTARLREENTARLRDENAARLREAGFEATNPQVQRLLGLVAALEGFPRHLSQHVGGFVIARGLLEELVPVENASMPGRTVIQWDKDDLDELGLLKVDVLALGMLTAIRRALDYLGAWEGRTLTMAEVPAEDPATYAMICRADTVGVFQIESRAQMAMLPRLRPRHYYDLVIQVAIVRPGPIQGDMVHPYLRRRNGEEPATYPSREVKSVLERTLGVPLFQEQVMQVAIVAAGFTPGEADQLRRAMAAWKRRGGLGPFEERLLEGMRLRGYAPHFAAQLFRQIRGFGDYGFPESHAASFALLVYVSAWLKCHAPAAFLAALLDSQPMGFYAPAQLVRDARAHGVEVRAVTVQHSGQGCVLERAADGQPAVRLGLDRVAGLGVAAGQRIAVARAAGVAFSSVQELAERRCTRGAGGSSPSCGLGGGGRGRFPTAVSGAAHHGSDSVTARADGG
jgi:error-prone DNA polymerase